MLPVRYKLNLYILFVFRMVLLINSKCFLKSINRLVFVAETKFVFCVQGIFKYRD
jgi:hypothetical protein